MSTAPKYNAKEFDDLFKRMIAQTDERIAQVSGEGCQNLIVPQSAAGRQARNLSGIQSADTLGARIQSTDESAPGPVGWVGEDGEWIPAEGERFDA